MKIKNIIIWLVMLGCNIMLIRFMYTVGYKSILIFCYGFISSMVVMFYILYNKYDRVNMLIESINNLTKINKINKE